MDINPSSQGQCLNANISENNHEIDNDVSRQSMQQPATDKKFSVNSNTNTQDSMSKTQGNGCEKTSSQDNDEPLPSTSSENKDLPVCFERSLDGCVIKTPTNNDSITGDERSNPNVDHIVHCFIPPSSSDVINTHESQVGNKLNNNPKSESQASCDLEILHDAASDAQRETDTKSPEMVLDEVQKEVTKLNISGEEAKSEQESSKTPSKVVVNKHSESLKKLMAYAGDSDSDEQSDTEFEDKTAGSSKPEESNQNAQITWRKNQEGVSGSSDSESDSSASTLSSDSDSESENSDGEFNNSDGDSASVIDASDDGIRTESPVLNKTNDKGAVKKTNKTVHDFPDYLPPIPDLSILNINSEEEFMHIGRISAIIAELVTVEAIPGTPAFDLDSMLFIDDETAKKPIGPIFDVLGPVSEPIYCVRFNNEEEIKKMGIQSGLKVYAAPKSEEFTKFVFVKELLKIKGTDASWLNDQEQPTEMAEFSDDEQERQARRAGKASTKRKLEDSSLERHKRYEKTMNQCNTLNTRVCKLMDAHKNLSRQIRPNPREELPPPGCLELPAVPAEFNPTVPPPGFGHPSPYGYPPQATLPAASTFGQPPSFNALATYNSYNGANAAFSGPAQFGSFYANQPPAPHSLGPPPARWQQCDNFRRGRHNQRTGHRQNSDNYFTNNSRHFRGAGPSSQPF